MAMILSSHTPFLSSFFLNPLGLVKSSYKKQHQFPQIQRKRRNSFFIIRAMRAVVQRVTSASVEVDGLIVSKIGPGLLILIGVHDSDCDSDSNYMLCRKTMRFYWGNKPDFHVAMPPERSKPFYESLVEKFRRSYNPDLIKDGLFGAMMKVNLVNDGPVTLQLESPQTSHKNDTEES